VTTLLCWLPLVSASCQLVGTALIVYGLRLTSDMGAWSSDGAREVPVAGIVREHPWAVRVGPWLLGLAGLALQVVVAFRT
jgi:hypothetical protein